MSLKLHSSAECIKKVMLPAVNSEIPCPACRGGGCWELVSAPNTNCVTARCQSCGWSYSGYLPSALPVRYYGHKSQAAWHAWFEDFGRAIKLFQRAQDRADVYERQEALFEEVEL